MRCWRRYSLTPIVSVEFKDLAMQSGSRESRRLQLRWAHSTRMKFDPISHVSWSLRLYAMSSSRRIFFSKAGNFMFTYLLLLHRPSYTRSTLTEHLSSDRLYATWVISFNGACQYQSDDWGSFLCDNCESKHSAQCWPIEVALAKRPNRHHVGSRSLFSNSINRSCRHTCVWGEDKELKKQWN